MAKIVFEIPGLKEKFEALNDGQKVFALAKLGDKISTNLKGEKASIFKSWSPFHYMGCKTRLYGYKTPSLVDLKISTQEAIDVLNLKELLLIKGGAKSTAECKPATLESYLNRYKLIDLNFSTRASVNIPAFGLFYSGKADVKPNDPALPSECKLEVGGLSAPVTINIVPPAASAKVPVSAEAGAKPTALTPILLNFSTASLGKITDPGSHKIKLACEKPGKFEMELGTVKIWKGGKKKKKVKKLPRCKDAYSPAMQPAMRAAGKCR
jgi:hypothetical protein